MFENKVGGINQTSDKWYFKITFKIFISRSKSILFDILQNRHFAISPVLSMPFINKDASSNSPLWKVSMKYLGRPHKFIPF